MQKLLEYKMFKFMSFELRDRLVDAEKNFYRGQQLPQEVTAYRQPVNYEELIGDMNLARLNEIFKSMLKRQEDKIDPIRSNYGNIEKDGWIWTSAPCMWRLMLGAIDGSVFEGCWNSRQGRCRLSSLFW